MLSIMFDFTEIHEHTSFILIVLLHVQVVINICRTNISSLPCLMGHIHVEEPFLLV